ncbi:MAG TPA: hypothetical protein VF832_01735 [Longimicrobiales bacterium]
MHRICLAAAFLLASAGAAHAQERPAAPSAVGAATDSARAWTAPEGTYILSSDAMAITVHIARTDTGLTATLQKNDDVHDPVSALSVAASGADLLIRFQPGPNVFTLTLRRNGAVVTGLLEGEGRTMAFTGEKRG